MRQRSNEREKTRWRDLNGIVLLDKSSGMSSNAALQKVRHLYRAAKAGHTGSLDPLATGLLPICFGEATKIAGLLLGARKAYETVCVLGVDTDTDDADGAIIRTRPLPSLDDATLGAALQSLTGRLLQTAPIYSALKQAGVPLYRRARRGEDVIAPVREVEITRLQLLDRAADWLRLYVECGSGTYIRSLVRDLGEKLGCGAHVSRLRRCMVEPFSQPQMLDLDALSALTETERDARVLPLESGLAAYPRVCVSDIDARRLRQGQIVAFGHLATALRALAVGPDGRAVALVTRDGEGNLRSLRGFNAD